MWESDIFTVITDNCIDFFKPMYPCIYINQVEQNVLEMFMTPFIAWIHRDEKLERFRSTFNLKFEYETTSKVKR